MLEVAYGDYQSKNGKKRKGVKMRNYLLNYLRYLIYIDRNRIKARVLLIKGHFKIRIQALYIKTSNCRGTVPLCAFFIFGNFKCLLSNNFFDK